MTSVINVLDETVINRIAAGEVVERPSSVVKELLENSIDAGATQISVDIENGGKKLIRVRDNGIGMSNDDAFLALERHATSKLKTEKDLFGIATMGFRGEALASIASVSRLRLVTKDETESEGMDILVEGGTLKRADKIGAGRGSTIEVRSLFFNAPVRAKFLKGKALESGYIYELVLKVALANTSIGFRYSEDGRVKIESGPVRSVRDRINSVFSRDVRENLIDVDFLSDDMRVYGFVSKPPYARSTMRSVLTFVNRRPVKDKLINASLNRAFSGLMERGRYPLAILFIDVAPGDVDVNVHPQKSEVRFLNPSKVSELINNGVTQALYDSPQRSTTQFRTEPRPFRTNSTPVASDVSFDFTRSTPSVNLLPTKPADTVKPKSSQTPVKSEPYSEFRYSDMSILGRIPGSFIVLHNDKEIIFLDHHAAHERLVFDALMSSRNRQTHPESQTLLLPRVVSFTPVEANALRIHQDMLEASGIIFEDFGENDLVVKACPGWIGEADVEDLLRDIVGTMLETGLKPDTGRLETEVFKTIACKASVKETTDLKNDEIVALLKALDSSNSPRVCPHGRPLSVSMPLTDIRRRLGRNS